MLTLRMSGLLVGAFWAASACAGIVPDHVSPLDVSEVITYLGDGQYRYAYSFVNTDTSPIWTFEVVADFVGESDSTFTGRAAWQWGMVRVGYTTPEYDPRNLDPNAAWILETHTYPFVNASTAIQIGEVASGFSFTASTYDPSPKWYFYETIASGWAHTNGTGHVAAVGLTPEPATLSLLALGGLLIAGRRRA